ncbi:hypothetical protein ATY76_14215 [Rhizobium sp. R339]|uniref:hypothetical protein n=1 Tax=Rhizobium sp. R339 TaxID=1764273 RepID=UPI000B52B9B9|nr:hypothetical protein [Rhizobium sp. R339]OWV68062.1 hypothetical protein ATY76_14215 [Rhizobium sp. R339]
MPIDKSKFDWNLNTIIQVLTLVGMAAGGVALWTNRSRDVDELQRWRTQAQQDSKELSARVGKVEGLVDNLGFRVQAGEQSAAATAGAIREVQSSLNVQGGDLRVMKEILQRIEATQKRTVN